MKRLTVIVFVIMLFCVLASSVMAQGVIDLPQTAQRRAIEASFSKLPLSFVQNKGQKDPTILFYEHGSNHATAFTREGVTLSLARSAKMKETTFSETVTLRPLNPSPFTLEALDPREGKVKPHRE